MTQHKFAKEIGVSHTYISEIEGGRRTPSELFLSAVEYRFGISKEWLKQGKGDKYVRDRFSFTDDEIEIIKSFREMSEENKQMIIALIEQLKRER